MVRCESAGFSLLIVGVDAHIDPAERTVSAGILGEFAISQRADVGIGPYKIPANPYFPAIFDHLADLPQ